MKRLLFTLLMTLLICAAAGLLAGGTAMAASSDFVIENGVLIEYNGSSAEVVIPEGVTSIGDFAFNNCDTVTSVEIPEGVTSIGENAFYSCDYLEDITIPDSVTSIGERAFYFCYRLSSVIIPDGVTSIEYGTFYWCANLVNVVIPDSVTSIGGDAFYHCSSLLIITIPDSVASIGDGAFRFCSRLYNINIPDSVTSIGRIAFDECTSLESIRLQASVTSIGDNAFTGCENLVIECFKNSVAHTYAKNNSIEYTLLPESGCIVENGVLTDYVGPGGNVVIPSNLGITEIGDGAFSGNTEITSVILPDSVKAIGLYAFDGCGKLESINIPDGVTSIGRYAFTFCNNLDKLTIPNSVTSIDYYAFHYFQDGYFYSYTTIYCYPGSAAHTHAEKVGIDYVLIGAEPYVTINNVSSYTATGAARETFTIETKTDVSAIGMYAESGALVKKYSGSSYYTDSDDVRTWKFSYDFANDGNRTMTFKALASDGSVLASTDYAMTIKGLKVHSAAFAADSVAKGKAVKVTVKTNLGAKYLTMYSESGAFVKKWDAATYSKVSGTNRVWTLSYTFSSIGMRTMTFKASLDGNSVVGSGAKASITVREPKFDVASANFKETVAYKGESVTLTVKTGADAEYLMMYAESGSLAKKWSASGNSTVSGDQRIWTVKYAFGSGGVRKVTLKASADGSTTGVSQTASLVISSGVPATGYASFSKSTALKGESVSITVKTNADATQLRLYSETGARAKTWSASGNSTVSGLERIWNVTYSFGGTGNRSVSFRATKDGSNMGYAQTAKITIREADYAVKSAAFTSSIAYKGESTALTVKTGEEAQYLMMYSETGALAKKWSASDNSTVSDGVRTWKVKYAFGGTGTRTVTLKGSMDGSSTGSGKSASILITATGTPTVNYAAFGSDSAAKGESVTITVKTNADAAYLKMYSENGALAKIWKAEGNSMVNGTERIWNVSYSFGGTGSRMLTFKASSDGTVMGSGKTASITVE